MDTGYLFPTTSSQDASGTDAWTTLTDIYADDAGGGGGGGSGYAQVTLRAGDSAHITTLGGFALSGLPDSATVVGIEVVLEADGTAGSGTSVPVFAATIKGSAAKTITGPSRTVAYTVYTLGSSSDTWGLSAGNRLGSTFKSGLAVTLGATVAAGLSGQTETRVDYLKIRITYTEAAGRRQVRHSFWL